MRLLYDDLFYAMWSAWLLYWIVSARNVKAPLRRESVLSRWAHLGPLILCAYLLLGGVPMWPALTSPLLARTAQTFWIAATVTAAGLLFTVWARCHIGSNWSADVTIKSGHELITTGPYALVRHPIYTGLLMAFAGSAFAVAELRGALAFAIAFLALWRKLKLEERYLREQFGSAYRTYAQRVAAIVPFLF